MASAETASQCNPSHGSPDLPVNLPAHPLIAQDAIDVLA
jgi:hypothetical protein